MNLYNDSGIISSLGYNLREQLLSISGHCSACVNVGVPSGSRFLQIFIYDTRVTVLYGNSCDLELRSRCCSLPKYRIITIQSY